MMDWNSKERRAFAKAFLSLRNTSEVHRFLRDLLTGTEIEEFSKRFQTARMLTENVPYSVIEKKTGLSSTTIARVARWLHKGKGGYALVLKRLKKV